MQNLDSIEWIQDDTIQELQALRGKLQSLQETFEKQITYLKEPKYPLTWTDLLTKFNMLTAKFTTLSNDFYRYTDPTSGARLPTLMLHPLNPTTTEQETNILGVLLRTKLIPDIEKFEADTKASIAREQGGDASANDAQVVQQQLQHWKELRDKYDRWVQQMASAVEELKSQLQEELYSVSLPQSKDRDDSSPWVKAGFSSESDWRQWRLENLICFYSSGRSDFAEGSIKKPTDTKS